MAGILKLIGRAVDDLVKMGYPESVAKRISSGELPMDEASRMARAAEQGYDVDNIMYHGANPTAIQKIAIDGFKSSKGMPNEPKYGEVYFTPSRKYAQDYSYTGGRGFAGYEYPHDWELPTEKPLIGIEVGSKKNTMIPAFLRDAKKEALAKEFSANTNDIRSILAAFDPEYTGSNILGSRIAPTAGAGLLGILGLTEKDLEDLK